MKINSTKEGERIEHHKIALKRDRVSLWGDEKERNRLDHHNGAEEEEKTMTAAKTWFQVRDHLWPSLLYRDADVLGFKGKDPEIWRKARKNTWPNLEEVRRWVWPAGQRRAITMLWGYW